MRVVKTVLALVAVALITGCAASGPKYTEIAASIPPVPANKGRVYFYRADTMFGAAVTSDISLNGKVVGKSERGSFLFADENPGKCTVATSTEVEKQLTFMLAPGETKYVETSVSMGVMVGRISPQLVGAEQARNEISSGLAYTGAPLAGASAKK